MHNGKIENYNFVHGLHRNMITGKWFPLHPHQLGRALTHDEMDYNLLYSQQTIAGWRIFGQNEDLTLSDNELTKSLIFWKISENDIDYDRYVSDGYSIGQYIWITPLFDCDDFIILSESSSDTTLDFCESFTIQLVSTTDAIDACASFGITSEGATLAIYATPEPTATATPEPTATEVPPTATPEPTATAVPTPTPTATPEWNNLVMSGGFSFNGLLTGSHWQTANNGGSYDNVPGSQIGFSFGQTLTDGLLDTTLIQNLLDDAYYFEQDPSISTWPQLIAHPYGGATYFGPGIGQVQVGQQLYDGNTTNPWTQDPESRYEAGAAQVSLIDGGVQVNNGPDMVTENQEWQQNGGTIRVIAWDDNGIVTDVQDFTVPTSTPEPTATEVPPTATPVPPTATPEPTATEVPPTATPEPTVVVDPFEGYYTYYMTTPIEKLPYPNNQSAQDLYCAPGETITTAVKHISGDVLNMGDAAFFNLDGTPYTLPNTNTGITFHVLIFRADKYADRGYDIGSNTTELDLRRSGGQYGGHLMLKTDTVPGPDGYSGNVTGAVPLAAAQGWWNEECPATPTSSVYYFHLGTNQYPWGRDLINDQLFKADDSIAANYGESFEDMLANPASYEPVGELAELVDGTTFTMPASITANFYWIAIPTSAGIPDLTVNPKIEISGAPADICSDKLNFVRDNGEEYTLYKLNTVSTAGSADIKYVN
jgi:hypothetical protein